jgi:hypothetical protein
MLMVPGRVEAVADRSTRRCASGFLHLCRLFNQIARLRNKSRSSELTLWAQYVPTAGW